MSKPKEKPSLSVLKKHPLSIGCACLSVLLIAAIFYRREEVPTVSAAVEERTAKGERLSANITNSAHLTEQREALVQANAAVAGRLVKATELAKNLQYFYRLEAETGTKYTDLRQLPTAAKLAPGTSYQPVPFALTVEGNYFQLVTFLRRLENGVYFCRILNSTLGRTGSDTLSNQQLTLNLNLELLGQP